MPRLVKRLRERGGETNDANRRTCAWWGAAPSRFFSYLLTHGVGRMRNSSLTLLKFGIISLVSLHWVACVWALLPTLQHERHGWTGDPDSTHLAGRGAAKESEIPNFKASYLGRFPLVSADFWTSDHLSERSRSVGAVSETRARGTLTLKRR